MGSEKLDTQVKIGARSYRKPFIPPEGPKNQYSKTCILLFIITCISYFQFKSKAALPDGSLVYIINHFPLKVVAEKSHIQPNEAIFCQAYSNEMICRFY